MGPLCQGLGVDEGIDRDLIVVDHRLSVRAGAIGPWGALEDGEFTRVLETAADALGFDLDTPYARLSPEARRVLLYGAPNHRLSAEGGFSFYYRGVFPPVDRFARTSQRYRRLLQSVPCSACEGSRLKPESRTVRLRETAIVDLVRRPIAASRRFFADLQLSRREAEMGAELLQEIRTRLNFLDQVGLGYISLDRRLSTLSGGEVQRIRLASQIGSGLTGVLYLLDEPTIGLHPRDLRRLLGALRDLKQLWRKPTSSSTWVRVQDAWEARWWPAVRPGS